MCVRANLHDSESMTQTHVHMHYPNAFCHTHIDILRSLMLLFFGPKMQNKSHMSHETQQERIDSNRTEPNRWEVVNEYRVLLYLCWNNGYATKVNRHKILHTFTSWLVTLLWPVFPNHIFSHSLNECVWVSKLFQKTHPTPTSGSMQFLIVILHILHRYIHTVQRFCLKSHNHTRTILLFGNVFSIATWWHSHPMHSMQ